MFRKIAIFIIKIYSAIFYPVKITNVEFIPDEPVAIVANHNNAKDPILIAMKYPRYFNILAKKELFKNKFLNWFFKKLGAIPVDRNKNDFAVLRKAISLLKKDDLMLFPEGTRNRDKSKPLPAQPGVVIIAKKANAKILPITIKSTYKIFKKTQIYIHKPVSVENIESSEYQNFCDNLMKQIYGELNESH